MSMLDWAKKEVEIACKRENPDWDGKSFDYGCACYQSALKAYESLESDGHSGMSWNITKNILLRLMDGRPLTPIEDVPENWREFIGVRKDVKREFQCVRMASFFKKIDMDGNVHYNDNERVHGVDLEGNCFRSHFVDEVVSERFPITMPYYPESRDFEVKVDEQTNCEDVYKVISIRKPDGELIQVNEFYKLGEKTLTKISEEEYEKLKKGQ